MYNTIKFTFENEENNMLPFLDLKIIRNCSNKISFGIYRKSTSTNRFIVNESFHNNQHKAAAFNSMLHRLYNIPLEENEFEEEWNYIIQTANINGYSRKFVVSLAKKFEKRKLLRNITTLNLNNDDRFNKRICLPFYPKLTNEIRKILEKHKIMLVTKTGSTLCNILSNFKDKISDKDKSGIYKIYCKNCDFIYIGQTKRKFYIRLKEHQSLTKIGNNFKSCVTQHMQDHKHEIDLEKSGIIKVINENYKLDAAESFFINNCSSPLMNLEESPIISPLFHLNNIHI